jgi:phosphoadenosine phosphosulfate reductase
MFAGIPDRIHERLGHYRDSGKSLFATSSFQTHSIPLLHILSEFDRDIPVYFLDTGFHFPETRIFRDRICELLKLNLLVVESPVPKIAQRDEHSAFLFTSDPDRCCYLNKVLPMEPILMQHDVWISGVRRDQTRHRKDLNAEEQGIHDTLRYHPLLDWTAKMIWEYRQAFDLPEHPLEAKGYLSIGCVPCTRKFQEQPDERVGRWAGMSKEECGIHTEFVQK